MANPHDNFTSKSIGNNTTRRLVALKTCLENYLLSDVWVRNISLSSKYNNIVIEVDCNFGLEEVLVCFQKEVSPNPKSGNLEATPFFRLLSRVYSEFVERLDIEELVVNLKDTTLVIGKLGEQSIAKNIEAIFSNLADHHLYFGKVLNQMPYEIYIPVFEENSCEHNLGVYAPSTNTTDYFGFWGLYYESEEDAVIYDLKERTLAWGDLVMVNH